MSEIRYFFFKMEDDWFQKKEVKKLRSIAGGDTFCIIYLKLILKSLKTGGKLYFEGIENNFSDEIALEIDEKPENVIVTLNYLLDKCLIEEHTENEYHMNDIGGKIESKSSTALRVSRWREKNKEKQPLQLNKSVTPPLQSVNGEKESESYKKKELEIDKEKELVFLSPLLETEWKRWTDYKYSQFKFRYKDKASEQTAINGLVKLCAGNYNNAIEIINYSITGGYRGLFELKNNDKNNKLSKIDSTKKQTQEDMAAVGLTGIKIHNIEEN
jgi:predicted phage replisome organizer